MQSWVMRMPHMDSQSPSVLVLTLLCCLLCKQIVLYKVCWPAEVRPGDVESRYSKEYEEQLNPFTDFQDRERTQRRRQLNPTDRVLYEVGQMLTGSR